MLNCRLLIALIAVAFLRCASQSETEPMPLSNPGRIEVVNDVNAVRKGAAGQRRLADGVLYVPATYDANRAAPLIVALHGAGGNPSNMIRMLTPYADRTGTIVYAPQSAGSTWDLIQQHRLGPDVERIEHALNTIYKGYAIDEKRVAVSGFSDGASYALTLGVANGDLFTHVIAFSPGFLQAPAQEGKPRFYVSHGTNDRVLPIDHCSRALVPRLKAVGYDVTYREFDGPHTVPEEIATEAIDWFIGK